MATFYGQIGYLESLISWKHWPSLPENQKPKNLGIPVSFLCLQGLLANSSTHWVNLRLTVHARSSAIETHSGARAVYV